MSDEVTELKKNLIEEMRLLKGGNDASVKKHAYANIVSTVNKLQKLDSKFEFNSKVLEPFSAFRPDSIPKIMKKVKWPIHDTNVDIGNTKGEYNNKVALAVKIVSERHPELDTDSDKFGTIVNATVANLIAMWRD